MKTVTFCGHISIPSDDLEAVKEQLYEEIEKLILCGASEFLLGDYGQFDRLCARVIKELQKKHSNVKSVFVTPYLNREYDEALYDVVEYPPLENVPKRFCILKRNEYMVEKADVVVVYVKREFGGAAKTLEYAKRKGKSVIEINCQG